MNLFESLVGLNQRTQLQPLQEVLTGDQYEELFKEAGFGLEFEVGAIDSAKWTTILRVIGHSNLIGCMQLLQSWYKTDYAKFQSKIKQAESESRLSGFAKGVVEFFNNTKPLKIYSASEYSRAHDPIPDWKIMSDSTVTSRSGASHLGMEFITPMGEAKRGLNYHEALRIVPVVVQALFNMGLHGNKSTGLHLNISVGDKLNRYTVEALINTLRQKYNNFAIVSFLTTRESDALFQKGDYARKDSRWTKTFESSFRDYCISSQGVGAGTMYKYLPQMLKSLLPANSEGVEYVVKIPVYQFATAKSATDLPLGFRWIMDVANEMARKLTTQKFIDINASHGNRVELRGFGGARAVDSVKTPDALGEVLRLGLAQVYPFMDATTADLSSVFRATSILLREGLLPALNNFIIRNNIASTANNYRTADSDYCYIKNKCLGFELDTSIKEIQISITDKGRAFHTPSNAQPSNITVPFSTYKSHFQTAMSNVKDLNPQLARNMNDPAYVAHLLTEFARICNAHRLAYPDEHAMTLLLQNQGMKVTNQYIVSFIP